MMRKILRLVLILVGSMAGLFATAWAAGAIYFDLPVAVLRLPLAGIFSVAMLGALIFVKGRWRALGVVAAGFVIVVVWWLTIEPSNERDWQADVAQLAWGQIDGDEVTFHNVRNCDYRTETDYTAHWETRAVRISQITGVDLALNYWGSPWIAHPIASFQFADAAPICFSIETRKRVGQTYSAIGGLYRQFELIYVVADERDVIRLRTNYRQGEEVYLYRITMTASQAQGRFREYLRSLNEIRDRPRWYNAITTNCTTSIRDQRPVEERLPWDWRLLLNGKGDEMMFEHHMIATAGLSFPELKARSLINAAAKAADAQPNFSELIRAGLPAFATR